VDAPGMLTGMLQLNCCPAALVISVLRVCAASGSSKAVSSARAEAVALDTRTHVEHGQLAERMLCVSQVLLAELHRRCYEMIM
jgi:hypothetical protein